MQVESIVDLALKVPANNNSNGFPGLLSSKSLSDVLQDSGAFEARPNLRYATSCVVDFKRNKSLVIGEYTTYDGGFSDDDSDSGSIVDHYDTEVEDAEITGDSTVENISENTTGESTIGSTYPYGFYTNPQDSLNPHKLNPHNYYNQMPLQYGFDYEYDMHMMAGNFQQYSQQMMMPQLQMMSPPIFNMYYPPQQQMPGHQFAAHTVAKAPQPLPLVDMLGNIQSLATNHHGSRALQYALQRGKSAEVEQVVDEIGKNLYKLAMHRFGNFVVQKLFQVAGSRVLHPLVENLKGHVAELLVNAQGSRVVQTVLQVISNEMALDLIGELASNVARISLDVYGSFGISKCYEKTHAGFISDEVEAELMLLSTHQHGCRVVLAVLRHSNSDVSSQMLDKITQQAQVLSLQCYGNYVIQEALAQVPDQTVHVLLEEIVTLSVNKFGSNVVECCFQYATQAQLKQALSKLLQSRENGQSNHLNAVSNNHYGSYVIQKLMRKISDSDRNLVRKALKPARAPTSYKAALKRSKEQSLLSI